MNRRHLIYIEFKQEEYTLVCFFKTRKLKSGIDLPEYAKFPIQQLWTGSKKTP